MYACSAKATTMGYFGWEVKKRMKGVLLKKVSQALFT
jgi:hypothetical protein